MKNFKKDISEIVWNYLNSKLHQDFINKKYNMITTKKFSQIDKNKSEILRLNKKWYSIKNKWIKKI